MNLIPNLIPAKGKSIILFYPLKDDSSYSSLPTHGDIPLEWLVGNDVAKIMLQRFSPLQLVRFKFGDNYVNVYQRFNDLKVVISSSITAYHE